MVVDGDKLTSGAGSHETTNLIAIGSSISQTGGGASTPNRIGVGLWGINEFSRICEISQMQK